MVPVRYLALGASVIATAMLVAFSPAPAQSANGEKLFNQRCKVCHSVAAGGVATIGPNLRGVVGRKAGITKFNYSTAMKASTLAWNSGNLDKFLTAPAKTVPGTKMVIGVADAAQRKLIIDYLAAQR